MSSAIPHELTVRPAGPLRGELRVPGDKSISHRSLLLNALGTGTARIRGLLDAGDVRSTAGALRAMGVRIDVQGDGSEVVVHGTGALAEPSEVLDCGNSGTSMRLLSGVLAAEPFFAVLTGDASLRSRPMRRVATPLRAMGATIDGRMGGDRAPLAIRGGALRPMDHDLAIASAQVKSALLLAGRRVGVAVREPSRSRDHTERMLRGMGATLVEDAGWLRLSPVERLDAIDVDVPGDLSSAAFWLVGGSVVPGSELVLRRVGVNPTRAGVIDALRLMGAELTIEPVGQAGAEPVADVTVRATTLRGARIDGDLALRALDELPVLAVAAAFAEGETVIADAAELRAKESDRVAQVVAGLRALGVDAEERPDGMVIRGGVPAGPPAVVKVPGDHRIAMSFAIAGCAAERGVVIDGMGEVASSYPSFVGDLMGVRS